VAFAGVAGEGAGAQDTYTLCRCKRALPLDMMWRLGLPLAGPEHVEVLETQLAWEELEVSGRLRAQVPGTTLGRGATTAGRAAGKRMLLRFRRAD
jgi:hypothetical protein